jgi:alpha-1,2-mannosyltransferase
MRFEAVRQRGAAVSVQPRLVRATGTPMALTLGLLAFFLANAFLLNGMIWSVSPEQHRATVLKHSWDALRGEGGDDSWGAMQVALDHVEEMPGTPLYSKVFFTDKFRFQYPPSALFALSAMRAVDPERVQTNDVYGGVWPAINTVAGWFFVALTAAAVAALLEVSLASLRPDVDWRPFRIGRVLVVSGLTLTFYPIVKGFTLGQIQVWINGLFALGFLAWACGWKTASGILIGAISLIKPHYGLFLVWAVLRREMRFAAACAAMIGVGVAASVAVYGFANHVDYLRVLSFLSQHGEAYYPNQSVNGVLNRFMSIFDPQSYISYDLPAGQFPPFTPWIWASTLASSLALLLFALLRPRLLDDRGRVVDLAIMAITCTMASPIAWEHHYGVTLPIYAVVLVAALGDRSRLIWLGLSYVLVSTYVPATNLLAAGPLNVLQSTLFAGAIILLVLLATAGIGGFSTRRRELHTRT